MTAAISQIHSELFRGGGFYRKSILESLIETFGSAQFTYQQANARIVGFNRSACRDFHAAGLIRCETRTYPFYYRVHQPRLTHKLTSKERWMKRNGTTEGGQKTDPPVFERFVKILFHIAGA
jgi:hypothetical protein